MQQPTRNDPPAPAAPSSPPATPAPPVSVAVSPAPPIPTEVAPRLLAQMEVLAAMLEKLSTVVDRAPGAIAMFTDAADDVMRRAADQGVDLDERLRNVLTLLEKLTAPRTFEVLTALVDRIDRIEPILELLDNAPNMIAIAADTFDEVMGRAVAKGFDVGEVVDRGAEAAIKLKSVLLSEEFRALMDSGVLHPTTLKIIGGVGNSLVRSELEEPVTLGPMGVLRGMRDPDVQRTMGFFLQFARHFGQALKQTA